MKKILFGLGILFFASTHCYTQQGCCCTYPPVTPLTPSGTIGTAYPTTEANCLASANNPKWLGGSTCYGADGLTNCPADICCRNGRCVGVRVTREQCETSGSGAEFKPNSTCRACSTPRIILSLGSLKAIYLEESKLVRLSWAQELSGGSMSFYIERSRDGENFKLIGFADQNSFNNGHYEFTDINPYQVGYYRLSFTSASQPVYSQIMAVIAVNNETLQLMPNPAIGTVRILLKNMQLYETEVVFFDLSGRKVLTRSLSKGQHEIDVTGLPQGTYIIKAKQDGQVYNGKLIKN